MGWIHIILLFLINNLMIKHMQISVGYLLIRLNCFDSCYFQFCFNESLELISRKISELDVSKFDN